MGRMSTMKTVPFALSLLAFLVFLPAAASAAPSIASFDISPSSSMWLGEAPVATVACNETDPVQNITSVTVQTVGDDDLPVPNVTLSVSGGIYQATIPAWYFTYARNFTSTAVCLSSSGSQDTADAAFTMSNLSITVHAVNPAPILFGDRMEIDFLMRKDLANVTSGANFTVMVNGINNATTPPGFDPGKGWILYLNSMPIHGKYALLLIGDHSRGRANVSFNFTVNAPITTNASANFTLPGLSQNVTSEYVNWRTETAVTNISIRVYIWNGSSLVERAFYQDSNFACPLMCSRLFSAAYVANETGFFFAKTTVPFNSSTTYEAWTAWVVLPNTTVDVPDEVRIKGPQGEDFVFANNLTKASFATARMEITQNLPGLYSDDEGSLVISQDDAVSFEVNVNNVGNAVLENLKMHVSLPSPLEVSVTPPVIGRIVTQDDFLGASNSSFLVSVRAPQTAPPGEYPMFFKIVADEVTSEGRLTVVVLPREALSVDDIRLRIASYGIIIGNIEDQIVEARSRGVDVSGPMEILGQVRSDYDMTRQFFNEGKMSQTRLYLERVRSGLESATLSLSSSDLYTFRLPPIPWDVVAEAAAAAAAVALYVWWRKWSKRRPRLLKGLEQDKDES